MRILSHSLAMQEKNLRTFIAEIPLNLFGKSGDLYTKPHAGLLASDWVGSGSYV
jgi:hypothetical protein